MDEPINYRALVLEFLKSCRDSMNPKIRKALVSISVDEMRKLCNELTSTLKKFPETKISAFATESMLIYVTWATQQAACGRATYSDTISYDSYRADVRKALTNALITFAKAHNIR